MITLTLTGKDTKDLERKVFKEWLELKEIVLREKWKSRKEVD
jgi:hypothetical protein